MAKQIGVYKFVGKLGDMVGYAQDVDGDGQQEYIVKTYSEPNTPASPVQNNVRSEFGTRQKIIKGVRKIYQTALGQRSYDKIKSRLRTKFFTPFRNEILRQQRLDTTNVYGERGFNTKLYQDFSFARGDIYGSPFLITGSPSGFDVKSPFSFNYSPSSDADVIAFDWTNFYVTDVFNRVPLNDWYTGYKARIYPFAMTYEANNRSHKPLRYACSYYVEGDLGGAGFGTHSGSPVLLDLFEHDLVNDSSLDNPIMVGYLVAVYAHHVSGRYDLITQSDYIMFHILGFYFYGNGGLVYSPSHGLNPLTLT